MAQSFGDHDTSKGGSGKRPAPTIEGTATEVAVHAPDEGAAQEEAARRDEPEDRREKTAAEGEDRAAPPDNEPGVEPNEQNPEPILRKGPPPASSMSEMKSFVTHLAAGLLGGLVGVIGLAFAWHLLPAGNDASAALAGLERRIAKLESAPAPSPAPDTEALAELDARIKALESRPVEMPPDISGLTDRVAQLEQAMKALADAANSGGSVTDAAAIAKQIGEAEQRIEADLDKALADAEEANAKTMQEMQASIDDLKTKVAALAEAGGGSPDFTALSDRVAKLEAEIGKGLAGAKSAAAAIAFANLRAAVAQGRPYAAELATLTSFVPEPGDLGPLPAYAAKGLPTVPELARSFAVSRDAALAAASPQPSGSFLDRLLASASSLIKIKRVDVAATGDAPSAVLARAEALLDKGDLSAAVKQVETLQGAPRDAFKTWLDDANARLAADGIMQKLEATLLATAAGGASDKAQN